MRQTKGSLTEQELEIMKVVWQLETATVRQVYEELLEKRQDRLHHRDDHDEHPGAEGLSQEAPGRAGVRLPPAQPQKQVIGAMVREFVNRVFNGSAEPLLVHLVEDQHLTRRDLEEIRRTIRDTRREGESR